MKPNDLMSQSVSEFVTDVKAFSPTDRVSEVIGFMRESRSYEVIVEEGDRTSVVTIRDSARPVEPGYPSLETDAPGPAPQSAQHSQRCGFADVRVQDEVDADLSGSQTGRSGDLIRDCR